MNKDNKNYCYRGRDLMNDKEYCSTCFYYSAINSECSYHDVLVENPQQNWCSDYIKRKTQEGTKNKYHEIASKLADLTEEKNKAYGNSVGDTPEILKMLYPDGVGIEKYADMLTIVRILDKIKRIATDKDALGESPYADILGYCLLRLNEDEMRVKKGGDTVKE